MRLRTATIAGPREAEATFRDMFGPTSEAFLVWNGTGANVMALATMVQPADFVLCTEWAHIAVDETGAPERALGAKIVPVPAADGKLHPDQVDALARFQGDMHHAQPGVVSITQSTELGTVYTADEVAALCDAAHRLGMVVHMDGARLANATAALGGTVATPRAFTVDAGVDVLSFGGTKAGLTVVRPWSSSTPLSPSGPSTCASRSTSCRRRCASSPHSSMHCSTATCGSALPSTPTRWARVCTRSHRRSLP